MEYASVAKKLLMDAYLTKKHLRKQVLFSIQTAKRMIHTIAFT